MFNKSVKLLKEVNLELLSQKIILSTPVPKTKNKHKKGVKMKKKLLVLCFLGIFNLSVLADGDTPITGVTNPPPIIEPTEPPVEPPIVQVILNYLGL